ncbi:MAG: hypothetical protein HYY06_16965 [Deltaproteobacteria bacterium]|nr:hypothetical protein [Deltaproteobacteria bacterium]
MDPASLRAAAAAVGAKIGVAGRISIPSIGRYRLAITGVSATSDQSWNAEDEIAGADVLALLDRLVQTAVPTYTGSDDDGLPPIVGASPPAGDGLPPIVSNSPPAASPPPIVSPSSGGALAPDSGPVDDDTETLNLVRVRQRRLPRWSIGAMNEAAIGMNRDFFNNLTGLRLQLAFSPQFLGFAALAYAYYSDDPGFALVIHGGIEGRVRLGKTGKTNLPFRFSLGYAPENGGVLKLDMGLAIAIGKKTDLVLIPLAPAVWFLDGGNAVSMNLAIEINTGI